MRNLLVFLFVFVFIQIHHSGFTQEAKPNRYKEFYLTLINYKPIDYKFNFRKQISDKSFLKLGLLNMVFNSKHVLSSNSTQFGSKVSVFGLGAEMGLEYRNGLSKNLYFFHGPGFRYLFNSNVYESQNPTFAVGENRVIHNNSQYVFLYSAGLLLNLSSNFFLSAEISPNIYFTRNYSRNYLLTNVNFDSSIGFQFLKSDLMFSFGYRI